MGDMKIQKRYNEYLECLGDNITDVDIMMESIKKIINEETFEDMQKLYLLGIILQRNGMEYIHALKKRAVKSDNEIVKLNKVIKEKDKEIEKNSQDKLAIEQKRVNIEEKKANDIKENNDKLAEIKEKQLQIEALQTIDSNPYNDKIKNV